MDHTYEPREPRYRALKTVRVLYSKRPHGLECLVRSLSAHGARIKVSDDIALDDHVVVHFVTENVQVPADIVWRHDGQAGLSFSRPLPWLS